jgi:hypothetical protein
MVPDDDADRLGLHAGPEGHRVEQRVAGLAAAEADSIAAFASSEEVSPAQACLALASATASSSADRSASRTRAAKSGAWPGGGQGASSGLSV